MLLLCYDQCDSRQYEACPLNMTSRSSSQSPDHLLIAKNGTWRSDPIYVASIESEQQKASLLQCRPQYDACQYRAKNYHFLLHIK